MDDDIERQKKLEADSVRDGLLRYAKSYEYHMATDSKPVRDVLGHCLKPLADVIRVEQLKLKTSQGQKLEKYLIPIASVHAEPGALITLGIMFNAISRSEFNEGTAPGVTADSHFKRGRPIIESHKYRLCQPTRGGGRALGKDSFIG